MTIDRRSLATSLMTMGASQAAPQGVHTSERREIQRKVDEVSSLADQLEIADFDDVSFAARLSFDNANTSGGRGVSFRVPPRVMTLRAPLSIPDRIVLVGSGMRDSMFNAHHDGPMFIFEDVEYAGLSNARIGLGRQRGAQAIRIEARRRDARRLSFSDLDIAGGGNVDQIGVFARASSPRIISECTFDRLILSELDRPVVEIGPEGNEWTRFVVDQFGYGGGAAFDCIGHANHYQGRIAGALGQGATAFRQNGYRNIMLLRVDIRNDAIALDLNPDGRNIVILQRPAQSEPTAIQTPVGRVSGNVIIDGDTFPLS